MMPITRLLSRLRLGAVLLLIAGGVARAEPSAAPNWVPIDRQLTTSGQPNPARLAELGALGFQAVLYLAPPTVPDAVADEARIVARQGLLFVNLPIPFDAPTVEHAQTVLDLLRMLDDRRVLVHCQVNLRASTMVFLYRAIVRREDPAAAFEAVRQVWTPSGPWRRLMDEMLRRHGIRFEPL